MNGGGAEHPRSEGWSFPYLFCGTQVTIVGMELHIFEGGGASTQKCATNGKGPHYEFLHISEEDPTPRIICKIFKISGEGGEGAMEP